VTVAHGDTFDAIGVTNVVAVDRAEALAPALELARGEVAALDLACSRFRDDSDLASANRAAGSEVAVGPLLLEAVEVALRVAAATGGAVEPTVGPALAALGYDRDYGAVISANRKSFRIVPDGLAPRASRPRARDDPACPGRRARSRRVGTRSRRGARGDGLLRRRLPYRLWRAIHWAAYAAWPLAVAHGVGAGSDAGTEWLRAVNAMCVAAVGAALVWRVLALEEPAPPPRQPFTDDSQVRLAR